MSILRGWITCNEILQDFSEEAEALESCCYRPQNCQWELNPEDYGIGVTLKIDSNSMAEEEIQVW